MSSKIVSCFLALLLFARPAGCQSPPPDTQDQRSVGAWLGVSPDSRLAQFDSPHRQLFLIGLRVEWVLESWRALALSATSDVIPVAIVTRTPTYTTHTVVTPGGGIFEIKEETGKNPVFGAGAAPFGFRLRLSASSRVHLFAATAVGGLWFTRDMPVPEARRFNISFEYGGGIQIAPMIIGYKFHHLSNANSAAANPGLDSDVFYVGLSSVH